MSDYMTSQYDYELPESMIAQHPADPRDSSKLLVLDRKNGTIEHVVFSEIGRFLDDGDLLVVNNTRVFPARTLGERYTGGKIEVFFLREVAPRKWEVMIRCGGNPRPGEFMELEDERLSVRLLEKTDQGHWIVSLKRGVNLMEVLAEVGRIPLPPYIRRDAEQQRDAEDLERYQTVYASTAGAVAAPTAGLHFTDELLASLAGQGVATAQVTLHVGPGTFRPIKAGYLRDHKMHTEYYEVPEETVAAVARAKAAGRRVVGVGSTSCRTLEAAATPEGALQAGQGWTDIFIYPPHDFRVVDAMVTNFHLPRSSLLVMIAALAGRELVMDAYEVAKSEGYRFYSYGDAMLIL
jgi:S-adenosylmethionine:tRNA ribosyltransferase-isomerase